MSTTRTIQLANLDPKTEAFFRGVAELFCDPANAGDMRELRARRLLLAMGDDGGLLLVRLTEPAARDMERKAGVAGLDWAHVKN